MPAEPDVADAATVDAALEYCGNWMIDVLAAVFVVGLSLIHI